MNAEIGNEAAQVSFLGIFVSNFRYSAFAVRYIKLIDGSCNHSDQDYADHVVPFSFLYDDD
jgi:hypothetical protein